MSEKETLSSARKDDQDKIRYTLLPPRALREVARVYTFGASHYGPWNWHRGLKYSRLLDAAQRHIEEFRLGSKFSEHSQGGKPIHHLASAIFSLFSMLEFELEGREELNDLAPEMTQETANATTLMRSYPHSVRQSESASSSESASTARFSS
jgi:hypothetical protein